jgi:hypothetical protein
MRPLSVSTEASNGSYHLPAVVNVAPFVAVAAAGPLPCIAPAAGVAAIAAVTALAPLTPVAPLAPVNDEAQPAEDFQQFLERTIGEIEDIYFDSQEIFRGQGHRSGEELSNHSSDDEDYYDGDGILSLEDYPPWAPELLHYPPKARRPRRRHQMGGRKGGKTQVLRTTDDADGDLGGQDGQTWGANGSRGGRGLGAGEVGAGSGHAPGPSGGQERVDADLERASWPGPFPSNGWEPEYAVPSSAEVQGEGPATRAVRERITVYRRRRGRVQTNIPMMQSGSESSIHEFESEEEEGSDGNGHVDVNSVKYQYRNDTWGKENFTYNPKPMEFRGWEGGTQEWARFPTFMQLFALFWPNQRLKKIVVETNRYATEVHGGGHTEGGAKWYNLTVPELKAFIALSFYMGLKKQPNSKTYWMKVGSVFHCPIISNIMPRDRFQALRRCLHLTNRLAYVHDPTLHAKEAREMGYKNLVPGKLSHEICLQLFHLLW